MMTSLLRDSLGGNCMTTMIATMSGEKPNIDVRSLLVLYSFVGFACALCIAHHTKQIRRHLCFYYQCH
jgi:hypothetical protein